MIGKEFNQAYEAGKKTLKFSSCHKISRFSLSVMIPFSEVASFQPLFDFKTWTEM